MRRKLIAANWKMYKTPAQTQEFMRAFLPKVRNHSRDEVVVCPPTALLTIAVAAAKGCNVRIGAQNMHWEKEGAFTGEVSAPMLLAVGCTHVIIGHSERRQYFGETDETVNRKLKAALTAGLVPIVCVGEVLREREAGITNDVLQRQCNIAWRDISETQTANSVSNLVIAYEPVWAIGTGRTATPEIAADAHSFIRKQVAKALGQDHAKNIRILYGGSVKPENAKALMSQEEIDGALVGGASLDSDSFYWIVSY